MSSTRTHRVQLGLLVLLVICAAQAGWWILDQWLYMSRLAELSRGAPEVAAAVDLERRMNRYLWEGGFFLLVLLGGMGVLARAVRQEARLRYRQQVFLAAVSHELRSPIATSRAAAETLELRDPGPEERRRLVGRVLRNLRRLESMVSNLLETARIDEGEIRLEPAREPVADVLRPVIAEYRERAEEVGVSLEVELPAGLDVYGDPEALRTVVRNLLANAIQSVVDQASAPQDVSGPGVRLRARPERDRVRLDVEDGGRGFSAADRDQLFERFWRPGDEMRRGGRGAGLGLYIARALAHASGATIEASSPGLGGGATFTVRWPAREQGP